MEHIDVLCEVAPNYVAFAEIGGRKYLQLKENNYCAIEKVVQDEVARLRASPPSECAPVPVPQSTEVKKSAVRALF